jgi:hypothetical protein
MARRTSQARRFRETAPLSAPQFPNERYNVKKSTTSHRAFTGVIPAPATAPGTT